MKAKQLLPLIWLFIFQASIFAQTPGDLDPTFDSDGKVITQISPNQDQIRAAALQADGKIVVAGWAEGNAALARYNPDGSLDNTFDGDGKLFTNTDSAYTEARAVAVQADGKIVIAAWGINGDFIVIRFLTNGAIDNSFSGDGIAVTDFGQMYDMPLAMALQSDGKIVVAGGSGDGSNTSVFALARYNTDGSPDTSFSSDGKVTTAIGTYAEAWDLVIQPDGKIVVAGFSDTGVALARYNTNGSLDNNFGSGGKVTTPMGPVGGYATGIAPQTDGKIVLAGEWDTNTGTEIAVLRYYSNGTLDNTFSNDGIVTTSINGNEDYASDVAIQPDGKIVVGGTTSANLPYSEFAVLRYNTDGSLDNTFSADGIVSTSMNYSDGIGAVLIQPDGKILAAGEAGDSVNLHFALARYISGLNVGMIDFSVQQNIFISPNPFHDNLDLEYSLMEDVEISVALYDLAGRLIKTFIHERRTSGDHKESINLGEDLASGNYLLVLSNGVNKVSVKLSKQ